MDAYGNCNMLRYTYYNVVFTDRATYIVYVDVQRFYIQTCQNGSYGTNVTVLNT